MQRSGYLARLRVYEAGRGCIVQWLEIRDRGLRRATPGQPPYGSFGGRSTTPAGSALNDDAIDTTLLIAAAREGDKLAEARLFERVYSDLHRLAQRQLRAANGVPDHATSMVHEVYLRLAQNGLALNDRRHFFAVASRAMRQIVVDHARSRMADKRGAGVEPVSFDSALDVAATGRCEELLLVDAALQRLTEVDPLLASFVELRFFGGLKFDELSEATGMSERTLKRAWTRARAFLYREMAQAVS